MDESKWDVIIIGGGSGGLSAALTLVRAGRRVLVLDAGAPRNRVSGHMHAVLGHDGKPPLQLLVEGRAEIERHGGVIRSASVVETVAVEGGFAAECADGAIIRSRALIVATGAGSTFQAQLLRNWSPSIIYLENGVGTPSGESAVGLAARGIETVAGAVARVVSAQGRVSGVELADGTSVPLDAIFTTPRFEPHDEPLRQLAAERKECPLGSFVAVDAAGRTSVPGLWAVGNVVDATASVSVTIGAGALTGGMLNHDLVMQEVQTAVDAYEGEAAWSARSSRQPSSGKRTIRALIRTGLPIQPRRSSRRYRTRRPNRPGRWTPDPATVPTPSGSRAPGGTSRRWTSLRQPSNEPWPRRAPPDSRTA